MQQDELHLQCNDGLVLGPGQDDFARGGDKVIISISVCFLAVPVLLLVLLTEFNASVLRQ